MNKTVLIVIAAAALTSGCAAPLNAKNASEAKPVSSSTTATSAAPTTATPTPTGPSASEVSAALDTIWTGRNLATVCAPASQSGQIEFMSGVLQSTLDGLGSMAADRAVAIYVADKCSGVTPTAEAQADPGDGTFESPYAFGTKVGNDEVDITLGKTEVGVDKKVRRANQFNDRAPKGTVYVRVPVAVKNLDGDKITPWIDIDIRFVAASGESYDDASIADGSGGSLDSLDDVEALYKGGKGKGYVYFAVPKSAVSKGMYSVSYSWSDEVFVRVR